MGGPIFGILIFFIVGYSAASVKIISQGDEALVERLGKYKRKLQPGMNFIVPWLDQVVLEATLREQILDIPPQSAITKDNVYLEVDAVVYWRILDLERTYYEIEEIDKAIEELVTTTLRSKIGKMELEATFSSRDEINKTLLEELDETTGPWGVKILRVEVQEIKPPQDVIDSMQKQQAAQMKKRAAVLEAEGEKEAAVTRAEATVQAIEQLSGAFEKYGDSKAILQYLIATQYVEANQKLGQSNNSKILFMDPKMLTEGLAELIESPPAPLQPPEDREPPKYRRQGRP